jgi:hypothetical protein
MHFHPQRYEGRLCFFSLMDPRRVFVGYVLQNAAILSLTLVNSKWKVHGSRPLLESSDEWRIFLSYHLYPSSRRSGSRYTVGYCSGQEKPGSWSRRSEAHNYPGYWEFGMGNGEGMGRGWGRGGQFTSNLRPRWTRSCHCKEGFQVSKGDKEREQGESARGNKRARGPRHICC